MNMTMKRIVSLLLCLVMVVGLVPAGAFTVTAAETGAEAVDAAIFFSDLHNGTSYKESEITGIMTAFKNTGLPFTSVTSCGDVFSVNSGTSTGSIVNKTSKVTGYIQDVLGDIPVNYVWSDHDRFGLEADDKTLLDKTSRFVYGAGEDGILGTDDDANYYVYSLSMGDLCSYDRYKAGFNYTLSSNNRVSNGFTETVDMVIESFEEEAENLLKDRPLFIASHQPLFDNRNDNAHAMAWFEAINEVAEDMDVAFFFGHNHKYDNAGDYYYAKGSQMPVAQSDGWNYNYEVGQGYKPSIDLSSEKLTLNFTHMCAGYLEPTSTDSYSSTTRTGTAMAAAIYDDCIVYTTYNSKGVYSGNYALNVTVPRDHAPEIQEPDPTEPSTEPTDPVEPPVDEPIEDSEAGISVYAPGATGLTVQPAERPAAADTVFEGEVVAWDITVDGFENDSGTADVTVPIPEGMEPARFAVYHAHESGELVKVPGELNDDGTYTFHTTHFSVYVGGELAEDTSLDGEYVEVSGNLTDDYIYRLHTGDLVAGNYLIVNTSEEGDANALRNNNNSAANQTVTIQDDSTITSVSNESTTVWTFAQSGDNWTIQNNYYLQPSNSNLALSRTSQNLTVDESGNGYKISRTQGRNTYYMVYAQAYMQTYSWTANTTSSNTVYLFKQESLPGVGVTFRLEQPAVMDTEATQDLTWEIVLADGTPVTDYEIVWASSSNHYLVAENGTLTSTEYASEEVIVPVTATLTSVNGRDLTEQITLTVNVTVKPPVVTLDVNPASVSLTPEDTAALIPTVKYNGTALDSDDYTITWSSSDPDTVSVDAQGNVTAHALGEATITATVTNPNGKTITKRDTVHVIVTEKPVVAIDVSPSHFIVARNSPSSTVIGTIKLTYEGGTTGEADLTLGMLMGEYDIGFNDLYENLYVSYGEAVFSGLSLEVREKVGNDYPEYPKPGSVNVNKTANATHLQSTGVVNVELSASGIPHSKGVDVIVMLDMSSSMDKCIYCGKYTGVYSTKTDACRKCQGNQVGYVTRIDELKEAMVTLQNTLKESPNADNIKIAVLDFNGYYSSGPVAYNTSDRTQDVSGLTNTAKTQIYTNSYPQNQDADHLDASAFIPASTLDVSDWDYSATCSSGTNYDYAFDAIYQLGYAIQQENIANGDTDRELFVLFMSDGAPNQFNGYHTSGGDNGSTDWNYWLTGAIGKNVTVVDGELTETFEGADFEMNDIVNNQSHYHFYDEATGNQHRMANAVKGDPDEQYTIIRKSTDVLGDIMTKADGDYMYTVPGLGATMYSVAFYVTDDGNIHEAAAKHVLQNIPSSPELYIKAETEGALSSAFSSISSEIANAAEQAYFVDQLGDSFRLQLTNTIASINEDGEDVTIDLEDYFGEGNPAIEVRTYEIYKASDVNAANGVTADMVGQRKGSATVVERITFSPDGTAAYSSLPSTGPDGQDIPAGQNILIEGVIYASKFTYNGNSTIKTVRGKAMDPESFRWEIGTIDNQEWALSYYTYLEGSMEGQASSGSYATNEYATLYYKNWLGNDAHKDTTSPQVGWQSANVSYGFYLVDSNGMPIVNQTTGQTGSFANAVKVTQPAVFDEILLNNIENINTIQASSAAVLPSGYDLYDDAASYKVVVLSDDGRGSWTITVGENKALTTYVTGYAGSASTNATKVTSDKEVSGSDYEEQKGYDYTHTTVWFAVVWVPKALPDAVVIDYGLPVNISILYNDQFGENGRLKGVGTTEAKTTALSNTTGTQLYTFEHSTAFTGSLNSTYGKAEVKGSQIRYTPATMAWDGENQVSFDRFAYEIEYDNNEYNDNGDFVQKLNTQYYYGDVTVIPAANIYYEDEFVTLKTYNAADDSLKKNDWDVGSVHASGTQDEDRPDFYNPAEIDKNNVYGYDSAYANDRTVFDETGKETVSHFSMGHAAMVNVNADTYATAEFEFYGTGFDVISMTDSTTGVIVVNVYDADGNPVVATTVDTYYGYTKVDGEWVETPDANNAIYQVPVMRIGDGVQTEPLPYGKYKVRILATYIPFFDHNTTDSGYNFYLDAIRIYNPAGDGQDMVFDEDGTVRDMTIEDVYAADGEGWPLYQELRELIISAGDFNAAVEGQQNEGVIFIDHAKGAYTISDYTSYGPNNELYLAQGQSVAFEINLSDYIIDKTVLDNSGEPTTIQVSNVASVQLGVKSADGSPVALTLTANNVAREREFNTATEMYYTFSHMLDLGTDTTGADKSNDSKTTVIIKNTSDSETAIVSITNIKITFKDDPAHYSTEANGIDVNWSPAIGQEALDMLREPVVEDTPIVNPFTDIAEGDYFYQPVMWALKNEITDGTAVDTFSPVEGATRAQVVTFLWRAAGQPAPRGDASRFTDLEEDAYYQDAVAWAVEKGITLGATETTFEPDATCTRAQIVTFLYRFTGSPVVKTANPFTDVADDAYYAPAVLWAMLNGITLGDGQSNTFNPEGICQRCQIVTFLHRAETGNGNSANS